MKPISSTTHLDLERLRDFALVPSDLHPLMATLAADLQTLLQALESELARPNPANHVLHHHLHALKGIVGMFGGADLGAQITVADDVCRQGDLVRGVPLARGLLPDLKGWLGEVEAWLQRYS